MGELIARQAEVFAEDWPNDEHYARTRQQMGPDFINFQHDPVACAIALGWTEGVEIESVPLRFELRDGWLHETPDTAGIPTPLVTKIDGNAFNNFWCDLVCG